MPRSVIRHVATGAGRFFWSFARVQSHNFVGRQTNRYHDAGANIGAAPALAAAPELLPDPEVVALHRQVIDR